jgi:hypothetical protein
MRDLRAVRKKKDGAGASVLVAQAAFAAMQQAAADRGRGDPLIPIGCLSDNKEGVAWSRQPPRPSASQLS